MESVVLLLNANEPPAPVLVQATTRPAVATTLLFPSTNWALIVTALPATGAALVELTKYFAAVPTVVVIAALVPVNACASVPVIVWTVPATTLFVNVTVATPLPVVVLVALANPPPEPVLLHVTTLPEALTGLLFASANCAVIETVLPATGFKLVELTRYFVAVPAVAVTLAVVPVSKSVSVPVNA
jgi:hypothetical protein